MLVVDGFIVKLSSLKPTNSNRKAFMLSPMYAEKGGLFADAGNGAMRPTWGAYGETRQALGDVLQSHAEMRGFDVSPLTEDSTGEYPEVSITFGIRSLTKIVSTDRDRTKRLLPSEFKSLPLEVQFALRAFAGEQISAEAVSALSAREPAPMDQLAERRAA